MKFSVSSSELLKQLQIVQGTIGSNAVLPILESFLFTIKEGRLHIAGSNIETSIRTSLPVNAAGDGSVAIPAKILTDTLKLLKKQTVTFLVDTETFGIELTSDFGRYKLSGENGAYFPIIPEPEQTDAAIITANVLQQAIAQTLFVTSNDDIRHVLNGIFFSIDFNNITFVATDTWRLVKYKAANNVKSDVSASFIVPKKALNLLKNSLPNDGEVRLLFNKNNAFFSFGDVQLACRLIDARYPDYNAVIPLNNNNIATLNRTAVLSSLKRINIYANKTTNQAVFSFEGATVTISAKDLDFSNEAVEQLQCSYEGENMVIAFNAKLLIEMLGALEGEEVRIELSTPSRAGVLKPTEEVAGEDLLMLVMPVMI